MSKRKKVVLYNPISVFYDMPLALLAVGSALDPTQYEVKIIDGRLGNPIPELKAHMEDAICFGVTCLTGAPLKDAVTISEQVKSWHPECPIIWGGWHPSLFPTATLHDLDFVDVTVQGQGEQTFIELVHAIDNKYAFTDIAGICFRNETGEVVQNKARNLSNPDEFPLANYDLIDVERYYEKKGKRQFDYISSTGCFFRCTFCADPFVFNRRFKAIEPATMVKELARWHKKYPFTDVNFQDETFFTYQKRINTFCEELIAQQLNVSWAATMRADQGMRMSEEEFILCKKSGLRRVLIGVESGSEEMLLWLKKDIKLPQILACAARCKTHGIHVHFPFIVGFPNESKESVGKSISLIKKLRKMSPNFQTPIFYFKPYPGTEITRQVEAEGFKLPKTTNEWADFDFVGSRGPWVDDEKFHYFEHFKFYLKLAFNQLPVILKPLQLIARYRLSKHFFHLPLEKKLADQLLPQKKLS